MSNANNRSAAFSFRHAAPDGVRWDAALVFNRSIDESKGEQVGERGGGGKGEEGFCRRLRRLWSERVHCAWLTLARVLYVILILANIVNI